MIFYHVGSQHIVHGNTNINQHTDARMSAERIHTPLQILESMVIDFGTDNETGRGKKNNFKKSTLAAILL